MPLKASGGSSADSGARTAVRIVSPRDPSLSRKDPSSTRNYIYIYIYVYIYIYSHPRPSSLINIKTLKTNRSESACGPRLTLHVPDGDELVRPIALGLWASGFGDRRCALQGGKLDSSAEPSGVYALMPTPRTSAIPARPSKPDRRLEVEKGPLFAEIWHCKALDHLFTSRKEMGSTCQNTAENCYGILAWNGKVCSIKQRQTKPRTGVRSH